MDEVIDRKVGTRHDPRGVRVAWTASGARRGAQAKEAVCQKEMRILTSLLHVLVEFDCGAGLSNKHGQALLERGTETPEDDVGESPARREGGSEQQLGTLTLRAKPCLMTFDSASMKRRKCRTDGMRDSPIWYLLWNSNDGNVSKWIREDFQDVAADLGNFAASKRTTS